MNLKLNKNILVTLCLFVSTSWFSFATVPVVDGLVLHLDAGSITNLNDGDIVSVWPDISGNGNNAILGSGVADHPIYKTNVINGLAVVRFGPDNCYFTFPEITNIRTVFWVCKENPTASGNRFLLGHSNYWDFHRGWYKIWDSYWASPRITNGTTRVNGSIVNGTSTLVPTANFAVISVVTTGNVRANQLTRDRNNTAASWHGDIAELLIYNRALSQSEINQVNDYLLDKYNLNSGSGFDALIHSPDGSIEMEIFENTAGHLAYRLNRNGHAVMIDSAIGISVDGADLAQDITASWDETTLEIDETYPWRGIKSQVRNHYNTASFSITHNPSGTNWFVECRVYNEGLAFRYIVPGSGVRTVNYEPTEWVLPYGSYIWYQSETEHYEGYYFKEAPLAIAGGTPIGFPVTVELPQGYALLTEAALSNYSGMTLRATGTNKLTSIFENRTLYDGTVNSPEFDVEGTITSPWRIVVAVEDLNSLVNCDIVHNVCPAPDPMYYPDGIQTEWIKPGKATWNWWHDGDITNFELQKEYVDEAEELGCQYYVADAGWWGWADAHHNEYYYLGQLCDYAAQKGIGIFVWAAFVDYANYYTRAAFYNNLRNAGATGVKFDFINSESLYTVNLLQTALEQAADYNLMLNFHGATKPTGEPRTWPNEITREGVIGLEWNRWDDIPPSHYATIPFTRLVAGHGDTTPCTLDPALLRGTTYAFQIATLVVHHSPLLHLAEQPDLYLASDALDMIRRIPSCWDQTIVLEGSEIGELAAFAKRKGNEWFVGVLNGNASVPIEYTLDLSFLNSGSYYAQIIKDDITHNPEFIVENTVVSDGQEITINLLPGGGYVAYFSKLVLSPPGGWLVGPQSVHINSLYDGTEEIHYTIDGDEPDANSPLYTSAIDINSSCLLRAKITDGDGLGHEVKSWFKIIPPTPPLPDIYLSDIDWTDATCGWGIPKKDQSVEGNSLSVAGNTYLKGIGTHSDSIITYALKPYYDRFVAVVGIDDEITLNKASIVFRIEVDDNIVAESPVVRRDGHSQFWHFDVNIPPGSQNLSIVSWGTNDGIDYDHADWVNAGFIYGVDFYDLQTFCENWLGDCNEGTNCDDMDFNGDGTEDAQDFASFANYWVSR